MAGRGRGRGMSFDVGSLGFGRGEALPGSTLQPPPLFPPLEFKPSPLSLTEVDEYLLALKQEFRGGMRDSSYYIKPKVVKKDIIRYSDKYKENQNIENSHWKPDWTLFPKELKPAVKRKRKSAGITPNLSVNKRIKVEEKNIEEITKKLVILEETILNEEIEETELKGEGEIDDEEEYFEEEEEEDNDYLVDYYNDGDDDYGQGDDGDDGEGPIY